MVNTPESGLIRCFYSVGTDWLQKTLALHNVYVVQRQQICLQYCLRHTLQFVVLQAEWASFSDFFNFMTIFYMDLFAMECCVKYGYLI